MEHLNSARNLILKGDFACKIDIKQAFNHIQLAAPATKWLRFKALRDTFEFVQLPFGPSSAPYWWTKTFKQAIAWLRNEGIRVTFYADDVLILGETMDICAQHTAKAVELLTRLGVNINTDKSSLRPSQTFTHLGFRFDTAKNRLFLPKEKIRDLAASARTLLGCDETTPRLIARTVGKLTACSPALLLALDKKQPLLRDMHTALSSSDGDWDAKTTLSGPSRASLRFLKNTQNIRRHAGRPLIWTPPTYVLTTDASPTGWGATLSQPGATQIETKARWTKAERQNSSNWKETSCIYRALASMMRFLDLSRPILIRTDNTTALSYARKFGGRSESLTQAIRPFAQLVLKHRLDLRLEHIPGSLNKEADLLSRSKRKDHDYRLSKKAFRLVDEHFGPHTIDLFASEQNNQIPRFCSRLPDPRATYVNAWTLNWNRENAYAFPPFPLIHRTLNHFLNTPQTAMTLICPAWPAAIWWPKLLSVLAARPIQLPLRSIRPGACMTHPMASGVDPPLAAFRLSTKASLRR